jgi:hypothetical protein
LENSKNYALSLSEARIRPGSLLSTTSLVKEKNFKMRVRPRGEAMNYYYVTATVHLKSGMVCISASDIGCKMAYQSYADRRSTITKFFNWKDIVKKMFLERVQ